MNWKWLNAIKQMSMKNKTKKPMTEIERFHKEKQTPLPLSRFIRPVSAFDHTSSDTSWDLSRVQSNKRSELLVADGWRYHLPNVLLPARHTALASILRRGLAGQLNTYESVRHQLSVIAANRGNFSCKEQPDIKDVPQLKGKLIGVEIECYPEHETDEDGDLNYYGAPQENRLTNVGEDGSLNDYGQEIRRLTWKNKEGRLAGLLALKLDADVDRRCGLHTHIDARHLGSNGLLSAEQTYDKTVRLYDFIKYLCPTARWNNDYCEWVGNRPGGYNYCGSTNRYAALNWCAYSELGSLEFRCQAGSVNKVFIEMWALVCQRIIEAMATPSITAPTTWEGFVDLFNEPLRTWVILRRNRLHGKVHLGRVTQRITSALSDS